MPFQCIGRLDIPYGLIALLGIYLFACKPQKKENKPNIILIVADDLGWRDLGCYGSEFYETPNLDALAGDGILFTNAYANCPVCSPSRASIQTGKYPAKTGVTDWIKGRKYYTGATAKDRWIVPETDYQLKLEEVTIAELAREAGYSTMFAGKWHLGEDSIYWPEAQGYGTNIGGWSAGAPRRNSKKGTKGYFSPYGNPRLEDGPLGEYLPDRLTDETIAYIEGHKSGPFFINLCYYLVHTPLQAKEEKIDRYKFKSSSLGLDTVKAEETGLEWMKHATGHEGRYAERAIQSEPRYASMVESLDENIGRLVQHLKEEGLYENTMIIFTSDNGGLSTAEGSPTTNFPLRAGKGWMYEGGIRVPFLMKLTSKAERHHADFPVSGVDIFPTIAEVLGVKVTNEDLDGVALNELLKEARSNEPNERPIFWHYPHYGNQGGNPASAIRLGDHKLVHDLETGDYELYNLANDIGEARNIFVREAEVGHTLKLMLNQWVGENYKKELIPNPNWDSTEPIKY